MFTKKNNTNEIHETYFENIVTNPGQKKEKKKEEKENNGHLYCCLKEKRLKKMCQNIILHIQETTKTKTYV